MSAYSGEFVARMMQENDDLRGQITAVISLCDRAAAIDVRCEWMPLIRAALSAGPGAALTGDDRAAEVCPDCGGKGWIYTDHGDCGGCSGYPGILHEPACGTETCGHPVHSGEPAGISLNPAERRLLTMALAATNLALTPKELPDWLSCKRKLIGEGE